MEIEQARAAPGGCARRAALACMTEALIHLDGDESIPSFIAAQLQLAIDRLCNSLGSSNALEVR